MESNGTDSKEFKSFFKDLNEGNEARRCNYTTRLDTYGCGCAHDCRYCYAKSLLSFRKMWSPQHPAVADFDEIRKTIQRDPRLAHIQVSITTTDAGISKRYEPGASLPEERMVAVERLSREGLDAQVRLSPYIPQFVNIDRINAIQCDKIVVEFLRVNAWIKKWMKDVDLRPYTLNRNGYNHLPLAVKKKLIDRVTGFKQVTVCEDVYGHWLWWKDHLNANPDDCCNLRVFRRKEDGEK